MHKNRKKMMMKASAATRAKTFTYRPLLWAAALASVLTITIPFAGHAQGIVRGAEEGAYRGNRAAGPVGGVVGGAVGAGVGGAVGAVNGVLGIPNHGYRHRHYRNRRHYHHHY